MFTKCGYCGKQIDEHLINGHRTTRISTKFCSSICKDWYWGDIRRIQRAQKRAINIINSLAELALNNDTVGEVASVNLDKIAAAILLVTEND